MDECADIGHVREETVKILSEVTGRDIEAVHVPIEDTYVTFGEAFTEMCAWFNEIGYSADIPTFEERFGFDLTALKKYFRKNGWD